MSNNPDFRNVTQSIFEFLSKVVSGLGRFHKKAFRENRSNTQQFCEMCSDGLASSSERAKNGLPPDEIQKEREFQTAIYKMAYEKGKDDQRLILKLSLRQILLIVFMIIFLGAFYMAAHPRSAVLPAADSNIDKAEEMCYSETCSDDGGNASAGTSLENENENEEVLIDG